MTPPARVHAEAPRPLLSRLDAIRRRVPFWWWLTYDAGVLVLVVYGLHDRPLAMGVGLVWLGVAVAIDAVEFAVKRP